MVRERHPEKHKAAYRVTRTARKNHWCNWCPKMIEAGTEYYHATPNTRYHLDCWKEHEAQKDRSYLATRERNHNPTRRLAYWFVTEFLGKQWSWNLHKGHLTRAKRLVNPNPDPQTGERQRCFAVEDIQGCLTAMRDGHFGKPILDIRSASIVCWQNRKTGNTFLEDWLAIPPIPPLHQRMAVQDWITQHGDRAVEQRSISADSLETLKAMTEFPT